MAVTLSVEAPQPQRRMTVAFRGILAIPHFVYAAVLTFVAFFAIVIAWFAALFTGRVPAGIAEFETRILQYVARIYGYGQMLLTDRYPPFALGPIDDATPYPVEVTLDPPDTLNRAAVLFRAILLIPASIVLQLVTGGMAVVLVVVWLITLITGRLPQSAFEAQSSVLRYTLRVYAFTAMLTSEYPRGLFGDKRSVAVENRVEPPVENRVEPPAELEPPELPSRPRLTRLVLSRAAKNILLLMLVLGVASWVAQVALLGRLGNGDADRLADNHATLETAVQTYVADSQACARSGDLVCARAATQKLINALERFRADLRDMDLPPGAVSDAETVDHDASEMISLLAQLSEVSNVAQYQSVAARLSQAGVAFDRHYSELYNELAFD